MSRPKLMLVENDPYFIYLLKLYAEQCGFAVVTTSSGAAACTMAQEERPDVIILEAELPEITGWEVLALLRAEPCTHEIPVVICIWQDSEVADRRVAADYRAAADGRKCQVEMTASEALLHKPTQFHEFVAALKNLGAWPEDSTVADNQVARLRPGALA